MEVRLTCTGNRPLMLHNVQLASQFNPYAKELKKLNNNRAKTEEDRMEIARVEFEGSLYWDNTLGPVIPGANLFASLIGGAKLRRGGMKVQRGLIVEDFMMPLIYDGPRDIKGLWGNGESEFVDIRPVTVQRAKVDRCRPIFDIWAVEANIIIDTSTLEFSEFQEFATLAGKTAGLGDYRAMYGRYDVAIEVLSED